MSKENNAINTAVDVNLFKYKYYFVDGTVSEIEVSEEWYLVLCRLDRKIRYNNEKNKTVVFKYKTVYDESKYRTIEEVAEYVQCKTMGKNQVDSVWDELVKAECEENELSYNKLEDDFFAREGEYLKEQVLKHLTYPQAYAYFHYIYCSMGYTALAKKMEISEGAVRKLVKKAAMNLDKQGIDIKELDEFELLLGDRKREFT